MAAQILETRKYSMFNLHDCNRDVEKITALEGTMSKYGWLDAYPAHVVKEDGRLRVKAGHHRITVAMKLGIPVKYVVCEDGGISIFELEHASSSWKLQDYLTAYCRQGLPDYLLAKKYCDEDMMPLSCAISLLSGVPGGAGGLSDNRFKKGEFKVKTLDLVESVADLLRTMRLYGAHPTPTTNLVRALGRCICVKEVDIARLKRKIQAFPQLFKKQVSIKDYLLNIEDIYNRQTKDKIQIYFLAEREAKARNDKARIDALIVAKRKSREVRVASIHSSLMAAAQ